MIREVCLFDKFSFCKNGAKCMKIHLKEVCQNRECDYRKCSKRHPKPCRIFRSNGFCRFGTSCRYSHRLPKEVEEQNKKIESIEKANDLLSKQVKDQNDEIKEMKLRLIEIESRELKNLQKQIDELAKNNSKKETVINKINDEMELEQSSMIEDDVSLEENVADIERCEAETLKKNLKADKTQNAEKSKEKEAEEPVQESEDIVFETLITSRKKKWAMKDRTFAECIVKKYKFLMELLDWLDDGEGDDLEDLIKSHFLSSAEDLEEEVEERKITNKELKAAVQFFKNIVNRPDFTNQKYKQILNQGRQFIDEEMKKVLSV